jgi:hypothetical protein
LADTKARVGLHKSKGWLTQKQGSTYTKATVGRHKSNGWQTQKQGSKKAMVSIGKHEGKDRPTKISYFDDQNRLFW